MKHIFNLCCFAALALTLFLQSCNEQPTALGLSMLYDTLSVRTVSSTDSVPFITEAKNRNLKIVIFNSSCVYVGKADNMAAYTLLRFGGIPDSLSALQESAITECYLEFWPNYYTYGDTADNSLGFDIYTVNKYWTNKTTSDSLLNPDGSSDYFGNEQQGTFSGKIAIKDSADPIKINLNKKLLLDWFVMSRDSVINWGIVLKPNDNSKVIRQFSAQVIGDEQNHATITMKYKDPNDSTRTLTLKSAIDASVVWRKDLPDDNYLSIQGAIQNKIELTFDISSIPPEMGILYSELELTLNKSLVKKGNMPLDSIIEGGIFLTSNLDTNPETTFRGKRVSGTDKYIFTGINQIVEKFVRNGGKDRIVIYPEGWSLVKRLDELPFYGMKEQNPELRPKLRIIYSTRFKP